MLIFDFDGVIVDSFDFYATACRFVVNQQRPDVELGDNPFADLNPMNFDALVTVWDLDSDRFKADFGAYIKATGYWPNLFEPIGEVLRELADVAPLYVVSASSTPLLRTVVQKHGIDDVFVDLIGGDVPGSKGEKIIGLMQRRADGGKPVVMIGDAVSDIEAAQAAGVVSVGVEWGWQSAERLAACGADYLAPTPLALRDQLLRILSQS